MEVFLLPHPVLYSQAATNDFFFYQGVYWLFDASFEAANTKEARADCN